jgi:uncharacterized protein YkwD
LEEGARLVRGLKPNRSSPALEVLEGRALMDAGVTAILSRGVLTVVGKTTANPIEVDVATIRTRRGVQGTVTVDGVATFPVAQIKKVVISCVVGEPLVVNRSPRWNPPIQVVLRRAPAPVKPPPVTPPPVTPVLSADEQAIFNLVNQARASNGLPALTLNAKLVQAAQIQAQAMASLNTMSHELPAAKYPTLTDRAAAVGYNFSTLGENIAEGYPSPASVMDAWMNSPGHRANILGAGYIEMGVAIAYSSTGLPYDCQVFGHPW